MKFKAIGFIAAFVLTAVSSVATGQTAGTQQTRIKGMVDAVVKPLMSKYRIPGMAVGIAVSGKTYLFNYGVMSTKSRQPVADRTLFEIGSITKTFTATLAVYAQLGGHISLSDQVGKYLPSQQGKKFGEVSLLNLGTHTPGGFPLQLPTNIRNEDQLMQYFAAWQPTYAAGTYRTYSNISIGMLGFITAQSMGQDYSVLMERTLLPALDLKNTYIHIPASRMGDYAQGYREDGNPSRMNPNILSSETYGIKTTAGDLIHFVEENMHWIKLDKKIQQAITETHTGYFKDGGMTQDLIWEQYPFPTKLETILQGNSDTIIFNATPVTEIKPPQQPVQAAWINKTGSTNGFGAYVAFVPDQQIGIVMLANKSLPIPDRVTVAYRIIMSLHHDDNKKMGAPNSTR